MRRRHGACLLAFLCPAHSSVLGRDMCSLYTYTRVEDETKRMRGPKTDAAFPTKKRRGGGEKEEEAGYNPEDIFRLLLHLQPASLIYRGEYG